MSAELVASIEQVAWPAVSTGMAAQLLALQRQFDATQFWPPERLRAQQFRQLRLLVAHAARSVPFHAARLRAAGIDPDAELTEAAWARLPVLARQDVQREDARLHAAGVPATHGKISETTTGGSTGVPVRVRKTALDQLLWNALHVREEIWHREDPGGTIARVRALPGHFTPAQMAAVQSPDGLTLPDWGPPANLLWRTGRLTVIDYKKPIPEQAAFLQRLRPDYLLTNPSNLQLLLWHFRAEGMALPGLRAVWTSGEMVPEGLREDCRAVLGVRIVDNYTAGECGYMALQCPEHEELFHVQSEAVLLEVLDEHDRPCEPGQVGRVVVTPLHNFAMPLLRYAIGDEAEPGGACACGRGLPVLRRLVGRTLDHLTLSDGARRRVNFGHGRLSQVVAIREFQVAQTALGRIEVRIVAARPLTEAEERLVRAVMQVEFGEGFRIELQYHDAIPRTAAGKLRPFISEMSHD